MPPRSSSSVINSTSDVRPLDKGAQNDAFFDTLWSDDMYLQDIEQYKDNPELYDYLLKNNPHLRSKNARFTTDPLTELFNYAGAAAKYYGNMRSDSNAWVTEQVEKWRQQDYNSAASQVERNAAAGLNSDLFGNVSPGDAAENDNIPERSYENGTSDYGQVVANCGMQFVQGIISFAKDIQGLNLGAAQLVSDEISGNNAAFDMVVKQVASLPSIKNLHSKADLDSVDLPAAVAHGEYNLNGYSRKTRKYMQRWFDMLGKGDHLAVEQLRSELIRKTTENNSASAGIMSSPWYSDDLGDYLSNVFEHLTKFTSITDEWNARGAAAKTNVEGKWFENNKDSYTNIVGDIHTAEGAEARASAAQNEYKQQMEEAWSDLMSVVSPAAGEKRKWYHVIGQILVMALRTNLLSPVHMSHSSSVSDFSGKAGQSHSQSFGWSF